MRVLLVEDNAGLARGLANALRDYGHAVDWLTSGEEAADFMRVHGADLAIIDVNLPDITGFSVVRALRARGDATPVLMLTARGATEDRVAGLDAGADDYLVKPFEMAELLARIRALDRRRPELRAAAERLGALTYDRAARRLDGADGPIDLHRRELALFECLLERKGRVVSKESLIERIYGMGAAVEANAVEIAVSRLRRKLTGSGVVIRTVRGLGYMLGQDAP